MSNANPRGSRFGAMPVVTPGRIGLALGVAALFAVAGYLRFRGLGHAEMWGDQSVILGMALRFVKGGPLPLTANKSSAGFMNPPLTEYLLALPLLFRQAVLPVVALNALLGFLGVLVCCWATARLAGWRAALIATLLFAVNPWAVHYARFFWNQNLVPFFSALLTGCVLLYLASSPRPVYLVLACLSLAAVVQLHPASLAIVIAVGLTLLLFCRRVSYRALLVGVGLAILSFLPYLYYLSTTGFADLKVLFGALGGQQAHVNLASFLLIRDLATGHGLLDASAEWKAVVLPWHTLARLEEYLFWAALLYAAGYTLVRGRRDLFRRQPAARSVILASLLVWIVVPALFYVRHTVYLQNYYFIYLYPAVFMLMGLAVDDALRGAKTLLSLRSPRLRPAYPLLAALLLGPILAVGAWQFHVFHVRLDLLDRGVLHFRQAQDVDRLVDAARRALATDPGQGLIVISEGHSAETSPFGLLADFLAPTGVRYVQSGRGLIIPERALYLDTTGSGWLQSWLGDQARELAGEEVRTGKETWRFYEYAPPAAYRPAASQPLGTWANGLQLWECRVEGDLAPGSTAEVTLLWQATQPGGPEVLHFFNHLVHLPDGRLVSQEDGPGVHSPYWQAGDFLVTRFRIPIPQDAAVGSYELRVGLYGLASGERVRLSDGGDALAARVEVTGR